MMAVLIICSDNVNMLITVSYRHNPRIKDFLLPPVDPGLTAQRSAGAAMLMSVKDACRPHPSVLRSDPEPDIEDIGQVIQVAERDAEAFFSRNHVTGGMRQMFEVGVARLDGRSNQAVYTLTQAMGGGKTHLMVSFGLIAKSASLRTKVLDAAGIKAPNSFGSAKVVAISGRQPMDHFIWGEIAHQLGKPDAFRKFWEGGPAAPGEQDWAKLIGDEPTLLLLDELAP